MGFPAVVGRVLLSEGRYQGIGARVRGRVLNRRLRGEVGWVIGHKLGEFAVSFVSLKICTTLMGQAAFGEYSLVLSAAPLLIGVILMPIQQAYLRYHHRAKEVGRAAAAARTVVCWFTIVTAAVALASGVISMPLAARLRLERWSILAGGLIFAFNAWRGFGIELLDLERDRRGNALQNLGFLATQTVLAAVVLSLWPRSATAGLTSYAVAAAIFGAIGIVPFMGMAFEGGGGDADELRGLLRTFGVPYGALLACQWVQQFAERYVLGLTLDLDAVGVYVAAFQVCGIPCMLLLAIVRGLVIPIAYGRARNVGDAAQLWAADRVLLSGIALYVTAGALAVFAYAAIGPSLLRAVTSAQFALPATTLVVLALARYLQCLGILAGAFFAVHQSMGASVWFRASGALISLPVSWLAVKWYGLPGAAAGSLLGAAIYLGLMCFGPGGCLTLVAAARREGSA
jgi:O-antigen/teichoic acid export membrane protein